MTEARKVYVGTYTEPILFGTGKTMYGQGKGIYLYALDPDTGRLTLVDIARGVRNPSYLAFDPERRFLYCVNEFKEFQGAASGAVSAFAIGADGRLTAINMQPSHGTDPCHLSVDPTGKFLVVANFASGSVSVYPINGDGSLAEASHVVQHEGSSVDPARQTGPHAHAATFDNQGRFVYVPDLGKDQVLVYELDKEAGKLKEGDMPFVATARGAGPRQVVMHPQRPFAYLINELNSTMTAYRIDETNGALHELQTLSTLPGDFDGDSTCAEVQISPSGDYLYGSNRGHDSIVTYAIDQTAGTLSVIGWESTRGHTPRNFVVSPQGDFLLAANQDTHDLFVFRLDGETGEPRPTEFSVEVGTPVCVKFL